jgi:hypothetical protein
VATTVYAFEKHWREMKNNHALVWRYLRVRPNWLCETEGGRAPDTLPTYVCVCGWGARVRAA